MILGFRCSCSLTTYTFESSINHSHFHSQVGFKHITRMQMTAYINNQSVKSVTQALNSQKSALQKKTQTSCVKAIPHEHSQAIHQVALRQVLSSILQLSHISSSSGKFSLPTKTRQLQTASNIHNMNRWSQRQLSSKSHGSGPTHKSAYWPPWLNS